VLPIFSEIPKGGGSLILSDIQGEPPYPAQPDGACFYIGAVAGRDLGVSLPLEFSLGFCHREIP